LLPLNNTKQDCTACCRERNKAHTRDEVLLTKLEQAQKEHHSKEEAGQTN
jgi:hypothetical protein